MKAHSLCLCCNLSFSDHCFDRRVGCTSMSAHVGKFWRKTVDCWLSFPGRQVAGHAKVSVFVTLGILLINKWSLTAPLNMILLLPVAKYVLRISPVINVSSRQGQDIFEVSAANGGNITANIQHAHLWGLTKWAEQCFLTCLHFVTNCVCLRVISKVDWTFDCVTLRLEVENISSYTK